MASRALTLTLYRSLSCSKQAITSITRSYTSTSSIATTSYFSSPPSFLLRVRPLTAIAHNIHGFFPACSGPGSYRGLSTRQTQSSLNDSSPNWSKRPPNETILLDGCDFEHWLVVLEKPDDTMTRDEIIDMYIETLAQVVGSKEEARMKIYSVSTKHYFAFGALVPEELSNKLKEIPKVRWVLPDSYLDVKNKDYGGEPFINGQAVPYDPKYHEEWVRNNAKAMERNRRNDRPRNFDRSRNFERRRQNMQNPPMNMGGQMPPPNNMGGQMPPPNNMGGQMPPPNSMGGQMSPPNNMGGQMPPPNNMGGQMPPPNNMGGQMPPPNNMGGQMPHQSNMGGQMPYQSNMGGQMPHQSNMGRQMPPQNNPGGGMPPNMVGRGPMGGEMPPNMGGPGSMRGGMPPNTGSPGSMGGGMHPNMSGGPPGNMGSGSPVGGAPNVGGYLNSGWQGQGGNMPNYQGGGSGYPQHHPGVGQHQQGNYGAHGENPYNQGQRDMPPPPPPNYRQ